MSAKINRMLPRPQFLLILLVAIVYWNTRSVPFVLDDQSSITRNASIRQLWPMTGADVGGTRGRPLANLSFAVNYALTGLNVAGYHAVNAGIHATECLLLFALVRRLLKLINRPDVSDGMFDSAAFAAAALWAVHPLQTEAVTYLSQRTELMMGLFYLLTLYAFVRAATGAERVWLVIAVAACAAGMACKEVMITAPIAVLLCDRAFFAGAFKEAVRRRPVFYIALAATWSFLPLLGRGMSQRSVGFDLGVDPRIYALTEATACARYFSLSLWPAKQVFDYGHHLVPAHEALPFFLGVTAGVVGVLVILWRWPRAGFLAFWPFLVLAPTTSIVPIVLQPIAEHRMHLPLACFAVAGATLSFGLWGRSARVPLMLVVIAFASLTIARNRIYASATTLWADTTTKRSDNDRAWANLGAAYVDQGKMVEAAPALQRALALNPENGEALTNLAIVQANHGDMPGALHLLDEALRIDPTSAVAHFDRGCLWLQSGRPADAEAAFRQSLRYDPEYADAHHNLAVVLSRAGKHAEAIEHYTAALRSHPRDAECYANRGDEYLQVGRPDLGVRDYLRALECDADCVLARQRLEQLSHTATRQDKNTTYR